MFYYYMAHLKYKKMARGRLVNCNFLFMYLFVCFIYFMLKDWARKVLLTYYIYIYIKE